MKNQKLFTHATILCVFLMFVVSVELNYLPFKYQILTGCSLILLTIIVALLKKKLDKYQKKLLLQIESYNTTLKHDIKTPAIAQCRAIETLISENLGLLNSAQKEILNLTMDSCKYLCNMVDSQLAIYEYETKGKIYLKYSDFDLVELINQCIYDLNGFIKINSATIEFLHNQQTCKIYADKSELKKALISLISNSILSSVASKNIAIFLQITNGFVELKINTKDSCITNKEIKRFFSKYCNDSNKFNKIGMGLGLYISKKIIEAHNGKIITEASCGKNNTLGFCIPALV